MPIVITDAVLESKIKKRIKQNEAQGYRHVKVLSSGLELWKKKNEVGGWTYYGESCGIFGKLWDNCLGTEEEFKAIAEDCYGFKFD